MQDYTQRLTLSFVALGDTRDVGLGDTLNFLSRANYSAGAVYIHRKASEHLLILQQERSRSVLSDQRRREVRRMALTAFAAGLLRPIRHELADGSLAPPRLDRHGPGPRRAPVAVCGGDQADVLPAAERHGRCAHVEPLAKSVFVRGICASCSLVETVSRTIYCRPQYFLSPK